MVRRVAVIAIVATVVGLSGCTPRQELTIEPALSVGSTVRYRFAAEVITQLQQRDVSTVVSSLEGLVELAILDVSEEGTNLRVRVEPTASSRDGVPTSPGPPQERTVLLLPGGGVVSDPSDNGRIGEADLDQDAVATLLQPEVPIGPLRLGQAWTHANTRGRLTSLARDRGRDLARLEILRERPVGVQRVLEGRPVELVGTERARTELLWDLVERVPSSAVIRSRATLDVRAGSQHGGVITIDARTEVVQVR